ncbi:PREDICTED: uncharacterized protein LOC109344677 [Lupinus angustifolius]|uniref:uncharacterized protein LOC109344677 n=1 Tax=Lupinus angustifolius TaxID=3871 RepID=UPI00092E23D3|nr:PREDICTED: uncharacterized protein LOC109344677 [Lupinus angustifolius]
MQRSQFDFEVQQKNVMVEWLERALAFDSLAVPTQYPLMAEEMTVSVLVDVTTSALCPRISTCSKPIYINVFQQTIVGNFKMVVLPLLGQLSEEKGRKPLLLITMSTTIFSFAILVVNQLICQLDNLQG